VKLSNSGRIAADLAGMITGDILSDKLSRAAFSTDASIYQIIPACVVAPRSSRDVAAVVKYASENQLPVAARGAGSGVAGEALCAGIVLDVTRYMNRILGVGEQGLTVECEPGVVLSDLNNYLAGFGRKIGPDPSTANRAVIGGCVANNATGAHSLQYGYIGDYVDSVEVVLADGSIVEFANDVEPAKVQDEKVAGVASRVLQLLSGAGDVIANALPRTKRNRSGYMISGICHGQKLDMAELMAGSEGTLGIFTKITLRTVTLPAAKGLVQFEFDSMERMAQAVPVIVSSGASACELMDGRLMDMAGQRLPAYADLLPTGCAAVLLVEHTADTAEQVAESIERTAAAVGRLSRGNMSFFDADRQKRLWRMRKDAVPLLDSARGHRRAVPFIEDVSVENTKLAEYIEGMEQIGRRFDIAMSFYGHAGDGELHIRPYLDLGEAGDVEKMRRIANDVFTLAWSLGGSISGEHADGLVRAAFVRRQYGDEFYNLLCGVKRIFDPKGVLNPGKIINDDADIMVKNITAQKHILPERTFGSCGMFFSKDEVELELKQCSGCGICRTTESELRMCPVFRALKDELDTSRAKVNILRFWATGQLEDEDLGSPEFRKFLDLCVNCKMCSVDCPAGVDVSKLMTAARAEYVRRKGLRRAEFVLGHNRYLSMLGSLFGPISNLVMGLGITKWLLEKAAGIDRRRTMPKFAWGSFLATGGKYLEALGPVAEPIDRVAYFVDTFANYNDHELGYAVLDVLRHNDIDVVLPKQRPAPLPAIVYGDVKTAGRDLSYSVKHLAKAVRDGRKIICSEPSAALCLQQELKHYVSGKDAALVSDNTFELMGYLLALKKQGRLSRCEKKISADYVYHTPCHLFAIDAYGASIELLRDVCGIEVRDLKAGCCGLAGTFGMQKKNYQLSEAISAGLKEALDNCDTQYVLTECAACGMQIEHISNKIVRHPVKVLAECYGTQ